MTGTGPSAVPFSPAAQERAADSAPARGDVLSVRGLEKRYGRVQALNGVDLDVSRGEVVGFLGPNGAGKTTFTKCILGFLRPTAGTIHLFGRPLGADPRRLLARVGVVPDQYDFYTTLTGVQQLRFYGRLFGLQGRRLESRMDSVLGAVGMRELAKRRIRTYSHGMKQRLCIAQALLNEPDFIIFDEPTNGLDPRGAYEMRELIRGLSKGGTSVFLSSHIMSEVEQVCSRVAIISRGRIAVQSGVEELRDRMRGQQVRAVVTLEGPSPEIRAVPVDAGVAEHAELEGDRLICTLGAGRSVSDLVAVLVAAGARVRGVQEESVGLEQAFLRITEGEGGM